jgi:hypothetical protein
MRTPRLPAEADLVVDICDAVPLSVHDVHQMDTLCAAGQVARMSEAIPLQSSSSSSSSIGKLSTAVSSRPIVRPGRVGREAGVMSCWMAPATSEPGAGTSPERPAPRPADRRATRSCHPTCGCCSRNCRFPWVDDEQKLRSRRNHSPWKSRSQEHLQPERDNTFVFDQQSTPSPGQAKVSGAATLLGQL